MEDSHERVFDAINKKTMAHSVDEYASIVHEQLNDQELAGLHSVIDHIRNGRILDIGVGAGRTTNGLLAISENYLGVDYVPEMIERCTQKFPGIRFQQADARSMKQLDDGTFDLIFFSCNGISMVDHPGRLAILSEARRLLSVGGIFIFSTCNMDSPQYRLRFSFPSFRPSKNPLKIVARTAVFVTATITRLANRARFYRHQVKTAEYAVLNDVCHNYRTMLYFITPDSQRKQLLASGFNQRIDCYDLAGRPIESRSDDGTILFVARKS